MHPDRKNAWDMDMVLTWNARDPKPDRIAGLIRMGLVAGGFGIGVAIGLGIWMTAAFTEINSVVPQFGPDGFAELLDQ